MINIQTIQHVADCVPLYLPHSLYLKPVARLNISVTLPANKTGKSISNLDIMEKLSNGIKPDKFVVLKVLKSTIDYIRFEAELDERNRLRNAINRLDGMSLKLNGFNESFRVRACEPKDEFPTRHDWDSFFRDANNMDEMKAGERPDTIHFTHLPIKWFCPRHLENEENIKPSESIFKRIFEKFGSVRYVDIPICDPFRNKMNSDINGMKTFSYEQDVLFEAYVQFDEYVGFVRAMDEFRGMKLVRKFLDKTQAINITVNFDTTKHLSDAQLQRRDRVRKRLMAKAQAEEDDKERQKQLEQERLERERQKEEQAKLAELEKQREREERRKEKHLKKIQEKGQIEISQKIRLEERKLMIAQRKLESIRILEQLFNRLKLKQLAKYGCNSYKYQIEQQRDGTRERLVLKYKTATEKLLLDQRLKVDDIKSKTPLMGLLSRKKITNQHEYDDSDDDKSNKIVTNTIKVEHKGATHGIQNTAATSTITAPTEKLPLNPFKAVAGGITPLHNPYSTEAAAASEWMKSLMFPYVSPMFASMPHLYRPPPSAFPISSNYRGFNPRIIRGGRSRGRGGGVIRGRGSYDGQLSTYYNSNYRHYNNHNDGDEDNDSIGGNHYYHKYYKTCRNRSRSRTRSRSKRRSRTRSRTRSHSRPRHRHYSKRTRTRSRTRSYSHSHSRTRSKSRLKSRDDKRRSKTPNQPGNQLAKPLEKSNKKLASTRRSHSYSSSSSTSSRSSRTTSRTRSRSRKRTHSRSRSRSSRVKNKTHSGSRNHSVRKRNSKRSWSRHRSGSRSHSHSRSSTGDGGSTPNHELVIDSEKLVRSAEEIKRTIEKDMQERMREEEREIKQTFNKRQKRTNSIQHNVTTTTTPLISEHLPNTDSEISSANAVEPNRAVTPLLIGTLPTLSHNSKENDHYHRHVLEEREMEDQQLNHRRHRRRGCTHSRSRSSSHHPDEQPSEPEGGNM